MFILFSDSASVVRVIKSSDTVIAGDTFSLTCEASGDPMPNVTWITVSDDEHSYGNILSFSNITRRDSGDYRCETKNRCGKESMNESVDVNCKSCTIYSYYLFILGFIITMEPCLISTLLMRSARYYGKTIIISVEKIAI